MLIKNDFFAKHVQKRCFEQLEKQPSGRTFSTGDFLWFLVSFLSPYFCFSIPAFVPQVRLYAVIICFIIARHVPVHVLDFLY